MNNKPSAYIGKEDYIFISYSHKDEKAVVDVINRLFNDRYRVWYDEGIHVGSDWTEAIASRLDAASVFLVFISKDYMQSINCRNEITFAVRKKKTIVSVFLEDTEMSLGMEMQLSPTQSIQKYAEASDDSFFKKLYNADGMEACREIPESAPVAPFTVPVQINPPAQATKTSVNSNENNNSKSISKKPKKLIIIIVIILVALALAFVAICIATNNKSQIDIPNNTSQQESCITMEMLYGQHIVKDKNSFLKSYDSFYDSLLINGSEIEKTVIPFFFEMVPDNAPVIKLGFLDRFGVEYYVYGSAGLFENVLSVSPCEESVYTDATSVGYVLQYTIDCYCNRLLLKNTDGNYSDYYFNFNDIENGYVTLSGACKEGETSEAFKDISAVYCNMNNDFSIAVSFSDGGKAENASAVIDDYSFRIRWESENRLYNGRYETFEKSDSLYSVYCINTYPYGFVLYSSSKGVLCFQEPLNDEFIESVEVGTTEDNNQAENQLE